MQRLAWWAHLAAAAATLLAYAAPYLSPRAFWPASFAALAYPSLLLALVALALYWMYVRRWRWLLSVAVIAAGWGPLGSIVGFGGSPPDRPGADDAPGALTVASYNLLGGRRLYSEDTTRLGELTRAFAACVEADVVAFEESPAYEFVADALERALDARGLRYHYRPPRSFVTLHARYPLRGARLVEVFNRANGVVRADVPLPGGDTVRVIAAHLQSNSVRLRPALGQLADGEVEATLWSLRVVARNYRHAARTRVEQAELVADLARASPYPTVVLGDLNDVPLSYTLGTLRRAGLRDAFRESGRGVGTTYPRSIPGLRIDYVLAGGGLAAAAIDEIECGVSDHRGVRARLLRR